MLAEYGSRWKKRLAPAALVLVAAVGPSGCGYWFGEDERILEGERIPLRAAQADDTVVGGDARLPQARSMTDWPQFGGSATGAIGHVAGDIALNHVWSSSIGAGSDSESRITAPPVSDGRRLYALDAAAQVTALDLQTGDDVWEADLAPEDEDGRDGFGGGLAIEGNVLVVATGFGEVIGLSTATGGRLWVVKVGAPIRAAPAVSGGVAVVAARDGQLVAVDIESGERAWIAIGAEGGAALLSASGLAISGEVIAAPFTTGDIGVFRLRDGRSGWREGLGGLRRGSAMSDIADISSPPVIQDGRIYAGGVSGRVAAFEIPTGAKVWARDIGAYSPIWPAGETLFLVSDDARAFALRASDGGTIWETQLPRYEDEEDREDPIIYGGPILVGGKLYLVSTDERIYELDAATGAKTREIDSRGASSIPPIAVGGRLYIVDEDGDAHAYE